MTHRRQDRPRAGKRPVWGRKSLHSFAPRKGSKPTTAALVRQALQRTGQR